MTCHPRHPQNLPTKSASIALLTLTFSPCLPASHAHTCHVVLSWSCVHIRVLSWASQSQWRIVLTTLACHCCGAGAGMSRKASIKAEAEAKRAAVKVRGANVLPTLCQQLANTMQMAGPHRADGSTLPCQWVANTEPRAGRAIGWHAWSMVAQPSYVLRMVPARAVNFLNGSAVALRLC